jgi:N-acetyl-gamma-glutamyl-phosphate reductase
MRVGIVGASGFTGAELLRLAASHPEYEVALATGDTQVGTPVAELYPSLRPAYGDLTFAPYAPDVVEGLDLVFCGLPHGASAEVVPEIQDRVKWVVDLSADFRHVEGYAYGLPELYRDEVAGASAVANPGCYPTAASLALAPLVRAGAVETEGIIVDAASGVSGAGRGLKADTQFCAVDEDFVAYGLLDHRHTPEIEQVLGATVLFTPHLAPMNRGLLATCYARPIGEVDPLPILREAYAGETFVQVIDEPPSTKATLGSNTAMVTARFDPRTGWVVALCALDNLVKGASGQAVQCANLMAGLPEATGLPTLGLYP